MTMRCDVETKANTPTDDWGGTSAGAWSVTGTAVPCWYWVSSEREVIGDAAKSAVLNVQKMLVPLVTAITEHDRVAAIRNRLGGSIAVGPFQVTSVINRRTHLELVLGRAE